MCHGVVIIFTAVLIQMYKDRNIRGRYTDTGHFLHLRCAFLVRFPPLGVECLFLENMRLQIRTQRRGENGTGKQPSVTLIHTV